MNNIKQKIPVKVLYVEDEDIIREQLERLLKRIVSEVITACDGKQGLEFFGQYSPDIIVTDIKMPKMNGLEMSKAIRGSDKKIPIIITTAHSESELLMEAIGIGVSEFLLKPVDIDALIAALERKSRDIILEKELDRQRKRFETIINFQDNMIFLTDGEKIVDANKSFLSFFEKSSVEEFEADGNTLDSYFINEPEIIHSIEGENWIKNFLDGKFSKDVVKIKNIGSGEVKTFLVKATKFPDEEPELDIISMSDITEMEKEAKILERLANTDPLTKIYNRLKLNELLNYEIKKTDRYKTPISLIMFDIDRFKNINDTFGHDVGDEVLIAIAKAVEQNIRSTDVLARWGGEEFMIMLPNTDEAGAHIMAENLRKLIASLKFEKFEFVTASFGVSQYEDDGVKEFLKRVDNALYDAKRGGRNMVSLG